jgi:glycosyltransferase involved in cell wall biosynthesis
MPAISVLLPVYNGQEHLHCAIDSILSQSFQDLELLIIDDGSTDSSRFVASSFSDRRIILITNGENLGLPDALNLGIERASANLIARQDQDDVAFPTRLSRQVEFLQKNPDIGVVGTWAYVHSSDSGDLHRVVHEHRHPIDDGAIRWRLLWNSPFVHSSVVMRRDLVRQVGGYTSSKDRSIPEDYDLWIRMSRVCSLANIPEFLQVYRETPSGMSRERRVEIARGVTRISCSLLQDALPNESEHDVEGLSLALNGQPQARINLARALRRIWLLRRASTSVPGFKIREHLWAFAFTTLRVLRNSLLERGASKQ